jgi:uncharacterized protein (TIGR02594 family)
METVLSLGDRGPDVERMQRLLNAQLHLDPAVPADGVFGPATYTAVRIFQASTGLGIDGVVTPEVWAALQKEGAPHQTAEVPIPASFRDAPWMAFATQEKGQREIPGIRHNPRILQYHATTTLRATTDETAWCSAFVNWCLAQAGIVGTNSAAAKSWTHWGKASPALPGAITVLHDCKSANGSGYHVAFLISDTGSKYLLLGGNQHDQVRVSVYPKSCWQLIAYRWPGI